MEILFFLGRILFGGFFLMSGLNHFAKSNDMIGYAKSKGMSSGKAAVFGSGLLLLVAGLSILLGVWVRLGVLATALFLIPVSFKMHAFWKVQDPQMKMVEKVMFMKNIALLGAALMMLMVQEPWVYSIL